jgi:hypothetical protein
MRSRLQTLVNIKKIGVERREPTVHLCGRSANRQVILDGPYRTSDRSVMFSHIVTSIYQIIAHDLVSRQSEVRRNSGRS